MTSNDDDTDLDLPAIAAACMAWLSEHGTDAERDFTGDPYKPTYRLMSLLFHPAFSEEDWPQERLLGRLPTRDEAAAIFCVAHPFFRRYVWDDTEAFDALYEFFWEAR